MLGFYLGGVVATFVLTRPLVAAGEAMFGPQIDHPRAVRALTALLWPLFLAWVAVDDIRGAWTAGNDDA